MGGKRASSRARHRCIDRARGANPHRSCARRYLLRGGLRGAVMTVPEPRIERSLALTFIGDWGGANFHRICSWLTQEFCDRAGSRSRIAILNCRGGGIESLESVKNGEAHLCISTPAMIVAGAPAGRSF